MNSKNENEDLKEDCQARRSHSAYDNGPLIDFHQHFGVFAGDNKELTASKVVKRGGKAADAQVTTFFGHCCLASSRAPVCFT